MTQEDELQWDLHYNDLESNFIDSRYNLFKFFADEHNLILTDGEMDDIIHEVEKLKGQTPTNEPELWEEIKEEASKVSDNPGYDYGIPYWVFHQFVSDLQNKYSIQLK